MALSTRCTVILAFVVATALVVVARAGASIPFVPDDSGYLISDSAKSKCEQKVAGNVRQAREGSSQVPEIDGRRVIHDYDTGRRLEMRVDRDQCIPRVDRCGRVHLFASAQLM